MRAGVKKCLGDVDCRAAGAAKLLNVQIFYMEALRDYHEAEVDRE
jgi:hypothetical protein